MLSPELSNIITHYFQLQGVRYDGKDPVHQEITKRSLRDAKAVFTMAGRDIGVAYSKIDEVASWANEKGLEWNLGTVIKRWLSDNRLTSEKRYPTIPVDEPETDRGRISNGLENLRDLMEKLKKK